MNEDNLLLTRYLVHSCLYYEHGVSEITDSDFDLLVVKLRQRWHAVDHPHKALVDFETLRTTTTGYYIKFPNIVKMVAARRAINIPGSYLYTRALATGEESALEWYHHNLFRNATPQASQGKDHAAPAKPAPATPPIAGATDGRPALRLAPRLTTASPTQTPVICVKIKS